MLSTTTLNARRETETVTGTDLMDICDRIRDLSRTWDNYNTRREADALNNHQRGRPAYWSVARYHDAPAGIFCDLANVESLAMALDRVTDEAWPAGLATRARLLATLIPLNDRAKAEKAAAVAADVRGAA